MKKIFGLGLVLVLCGSLTACGNKMSVEKIDEYKKQEDDITSYYNKTHEMIKDVKENTNVIWESDDKDKQEEAYIKISDNAEAINEYSRELKKISLDKLQEFHNYMVEYKGTTQSEEDYNFIKINYNYLMTKRRLAYLDKMISYYDDGSLRADECIMIDDIATLSNVVISEEDEVEKNLKDLQSELDKEYDLDSESLYELERKMHRFKENDDKY